MYGNTGGLTPISYFFLVDRFLAGPAIAGPAFFGAIFGLGGVSNIRRRTLSKASLTSGRDWPFLRVVFLVAIGQPLAAYILQ